MGERVHLRILKSDILMKGYFKSRLPNYFDEVSYKNSNEQYVMSNQKAVNHWSNYFFLKIPK